MRTTTGNPPVDIDAAGGGWTAREIAQQPALWRAVAGAVAADSGGTAAFLRPLLEDSDLRIVLTGAGSSAFAGQLLAPALARETGRRVEAIASTDLVADPLAYFAEDIPTLLVSFARSGNSPESVAATRLADECLTRCHHLILTCDGRGALAREHAGAPRSLVRMMPAAANDRGFAMTSSFTCMVLTALLTLGALDRGAELVERLATAAEHLLATISAHIAEVAGHGYRRIVYLGSGPLLGLAMESALKMLELTAGDIATWHDSSLGFRHGPKSVLDDTTLVVIYVSTDPYTRRYDLDMIAELRATMPRDAVLVVTATPDNHTADNHTADDHTADDHTADDHTWSIDGVADVGDAAVCLPFVLCGQLLALQLSIGGGHTPDDPFPSRQVNRVVQGVTIHPLPGPG